MLVIICNNNIVGTVQIAKSFGIIICILLLLLSGVILTNGHVAVVWIGLCVL